MFWTPEKQYLNDPYETESQLEAAIRPGKILTLKRWRPGSSAK